VRITADKSFKCKYPINEVEQTFVQLVAAGDDPDDFKGISFKAEGKGRISLSGACALANVPHEAVANFISNIISPGDYVAIKVMADDSNNAPVEEAWLIMDGRTFRLECEVGPLYKGTPYETFAAALKGKEVLDVRYRTGVVEIALADIVGKSEEEFDRLLSMQLTDDTDLDVKGYEIIGHDGDTLTLKVEGYLKGE
jgi:hypothetical protein